SEVASGYRRQIYRPRKHRCVPKRRHRLPIRRRRLAQEKAAGQTGKRQKTHETLRQGGYPQRGAHCDAKTRLIRYTGRTMTDITATLSRLAQLYQPSDAARDVLARADVVLLVGISGAGKDTIQSRLLQRGDYHSIITHTTRPPRANNGVMEQNGREYHFVSY